MKERPIIFSGPMARAILEGRKTQTRRPIKGARGAFWDHGAWSPVLQNGGIVSWSAGGDTTIHGAPRPTCSYGIPGDRLWVRETFAYSIKDPDSHFDGYGPETHDIVHAEGAHGGEWDHYDGNGNRSRGAPPPWRPSIHMPRWASRIDLEVTAVRAERLQSISEEDARAEGACASPVSPLYRGIASHREGFAALWDKLNGKRAPWASNPWVWVVEFRVVRGGK